MGVQEPSDYYGPEAKSHVPRLGNSTRQIQQTQESIQSASLQEDSSSPYLPRQSLAVDLGMDEKKNWRMWVCVGRLGVGEKAP